MVVELSSLFADHDMKWFETQYDARLDVNADGINSPADCVHAKTRSEVVINNFHDDYADMDILPPPSPTFIYHESNKCTMSAITIPYVSWIADKRSVSPVTQRGTINRSMKNKFSFDHSDRDRVSVEQIAYTNVTSHSLPCDDYEPYTYDECMHMTECGLASIFVSEGGALEFLTSTVDEKNVEKQQAYDERMEKCSTSFTDLCDEDDDMTTCSCNDESSEAEANLLSDEDLMHLQSEPWLCVERCGPDDRFTVAYKIPVPGSIARRHFGVRTVAPGLQ